jgi:hypothetical protein
VVWDIGVAGLVFCGWIGYTTAHLIPSLYRAFLLYMTSFCAFCAPRSGIGWFTGFGLDWLVMCYDR